MLKYIKTSNLPTRIRMRDRVGKYSEVKKGDRIPADGTQQAQPFFNHDVRLCSVFVLALPVLAAEILLTQA